MPENTRKFRPQMFRCTWKTKLKFRKEADDYPILEKLVDEMAEDMQANGYNQAYPIQLLGGKIHDGRHRYLAANKAKVYFLTLALPESTNADESVERANDRRRHETNEELATRRQGRIERAASAHVEGQSTREIAETEGVSHSTILKDLEKATGQGLPVEPETGVVIGKDKKKRKSSQTPKPKILCPSCETKQRKNQDLPKKCPGCKAVREAEKPKGNANDANEVEQLDCLKKPVPEDLVDIFASIEEYRSILHGLATLKSRIKDLCATECGGWIDKQDTERSLEQAHNHIRFAMPYTECPKCRRKPEKKCKACKGNGWITESSYGACASDEDKRWLKGDRK